MGFGKHGVRTRTQVLQLVSPLHHIFFYYGVIILGAAEVKAEY